MNYNPLKYEYPSRRNVIYGNRGMVSTTQPLAAQAGLDILKKGGNAIDAAIGAAACLTVLEPTSNGIGGDAFALIWKDGKLTGINGSGFAPGLVDPEELRKNYSEMPDRGWLPVNVPGIPGAWAELSRKYGRLSLYEVIKPAIDYAENGFPVSPTTAVLWKMDYEEFKESCRDKCFEGWYSTFAPKGRAPRPGEIFHLKEHAGTLEEIARTYGESFYRGDLAKKIDSYSKKTGGLLRYEDLERFYPEWVEPISTDYRGYRVFEIPPNGHGITALMALNIFENYNVKDFNSESVHYQIESMKLAFADAREYVSDPRYMKVSTEELLSKKYAERRFNTIGDTALYPSYGDPNSGGTVYLCTADSSGNMVSYIQSNYMGFGSGIVVEGTGIALHNRGRNFSLDPKSSNCIAPYKKPYHTIIPGFLFKDGAPVGPFGVMGAFMQPQGHMQVMVNTADFNMNPQEALDAPRWQWIGGRVIEVERDFPPEIIEDLKRRGHEIKIARDSLSMGRGQIIWRDEQGTYVGGTEKRADGYIATW